MRSKNATFYLGILLSLCLLAPLSAMAAADYPTRPINLLVGWAPGGSMDFLGRLLADTASPILGQKIIVVNKPGATGAIAYVEIAKSKPDGYTFGVNSITLPAMTTLGTLSVSYRDFDLISHLCYESGSIAVRKDAPWKTWKELEAEIRRNPDKIKMGTLTPGGVWHLMDHLVMKETGLKLNLVSFPNTANTIAALMGGHIDVATCGPAEVYTQLKNNQVRLLGVMSDERLGSMPDVPTFKEMGINVSLQSFKGAIAPKGTPPDRIKKLADAFKMASETPKWKEQMSQMGHISDFRDSKEYLKILDQKSVIIEEMFQKLGMIKK